MAFVRAAGGVALGRPKAEVQSRTKGRVLRRSGRETVRSALQNPDDEGPPALEKFFERKRKGMRGMAVDTTMKLGTGRGVLKENDNDLEKALSAAIKRSIETIGDQPSLAHVTATTDIDMENLRTLMAKLLPPGVPFMGRTIVKDGSEGVVEVLTVASEGGGNAMMMSVPIEGSDNAAGESAAKKAVESFSEIAGDLSFILFSHTPGPSTESFRQGFRSVLPTTVAYGGVAASFGEDEAGWAMLTEDTIVDDSSSGQLVVAAMPGKLSYMLSAVVRSWAQPKKDAPLAFLAPTYVENNKLDLLTAIRYNDWDKFIYLITDGGVDVNVRWEHKRNQAPLLAAAARGRLDMVEKLLSMGADPNARNDGGFTAIMYTQLLESDGEDERTKKQKDMLLGAGAVFEPPKDVKAY